MVISNNVTLSKIGTDIKAYKQCMALIINATFDIVMNQ